MTATEKADSQARLIKAISHPLRHRILISLNERAASPSTLAKELGEPLGNVSYHVKYLHSHDAIELVDTRVARGAIEHIYRAISRPFFDDEHWSRLPVSLRRALFDDGMQKAWEHMVAAAEADGFDDPRSHSSWTQLDLDGEGYDAVVELLAETLDRVLEIQAECAGRRADGAAADPGKRTEVAIFHYERAVAPPVAPE